MWFAIVAAMQTATLGATNVKADVPMTVPATKPSFADEFDGPKIDTGKWLFDTHRNREGWYNNERQYYADGRPENARIEDGALVIEARRESLKGKAADWGGQEYTSAKLVTRERYGYGFYEIRAKLPCGRGMWPAIWMLPTGEKWPDGGEIDIMEMVGWDAHVIHATLHTGAYNHAKGTQRGAQVKVPTACTAYHRYQLDWRPGVITIGIDGRGHMQVKDDQPGGLAAWPFVRPYELILNLAVGGDWGGKHGIDDAALPQRMHVDYVRYWAAAPSADAGSPAPAARPAE
ncbi:glycoside hydrolase family 16 protein [Sphingomonas sp. BT-65]|uniref:glycoside hydrolase family 16 protein n=1 Tax=Sphingomonas sp. BT-65 TaxID=2989821 RepID=UPI0022355C3F|nr:glycoside hydrolase family 16 protein [Sphingomonas sp. BT-65]MCW4463872.1 glycoside hydrolase family 16 protein [Sphingomonas sp. BT-65]